MAPGWGKLSGARRPRLLHAFFGTEPSLGSRPKAPSPLAALARALLAALPTGANTLWRHRLWRHRLRWSAGVNALVHGIAIGNVNTLVNVNALANVIALASHIAELDWTLGKWDYRLFAKGETAWSPTLLHHKVKKNRIP